MSTTPKPWSLVREGPEHDYHVLQVRERIVRSPVDGREHPRVLITCPEWANVVAFTPARELVLVRQFRFGIWAPTLEIPGGLVDAGESPEAAARRELEEETGYVAESFRPLGNCHPNPAVQTNRIHTYLAEGCRRVHAGDPDPGEDLEVVVVPEGQVKGLVQRGEISHALVLAAFYFAGLG